MLSEDAIEKLIEPILRRQEYINNYVIKIIAERIKEVGTLLPSDVHSLQQLLQYGGDVKLINQAIAELTNLNVIEIKHIIQEIAYDAYMDVKPYYDYRHIPFVPYNKNTALQFTVNAIAKATQDTYKNLSNSQAIGFYTKSLRNPNIRTFKSIDRAYKDVIDEAVQMSQQGVIDYNSAMRNTLMQLNDSGLQTLYWESGYHQRLDTAVRRNLLDGIRAVNQGVQDEVGKQFGADGKEITVHMNPAVDHAEVQGHQFSNEEFDKFQQDLDCVDVNGKRFMSGHRAIGELNCRHFTYSIILGVTKPNYTQEQLQAIIDKNNEGYTLPNGKHYTMYECTQKQRQMEVNIRRAKDGYIMAREALNPDLQAYYKARVSKLTKSYYAFSKACGLKPKTSKIFVQGYIK